MYSIIGSSRNSVRPVLYGARTYSVPIGTCFFPILYTRPMESIVCPLYDDDAAVHILLVYPLVTGASVPAIVMLFLPSIPSFTSLMANIDYGSCIHIYWSCSVSLNIGFIFAEKQFHLFSPQHRRCVS